MNAGQAMTTDERSLSLKMVVQEGGREWKVPKGDEAPAGQDLLHSLAQALLSFQTVVTPRWRIVSEYVYTCTHSYTCTFYVFSFFHNEYRLLLYKDFL